MASPRLASAAVRHDNSPSQPSQKVYSVPRRYDLATFFAIAFAYALLFAVMRLTRWPLESALIFALFVSFVGLGQAMLFNGVSPRSASVVVGMVYWPLCALVLGVVNGATMGDIVMLFIPVFIAEYVLGYVTGVLTGGIFLVAEALGRALRKPGCVTSGDNRGTSCQFDSSIQ